MKSLPPSPILSAPFKKSLRALPQALLACSLLAGCYTQLATRGYHAPRDGAAAYGPEASPPDSPAVDTAMAAVPSADTLAPPTGAPTVIVQNYYGPHPYHRGYALWEWDHPVLSFGYYSSHYGIYSRPYWWDDPWYARRHLHPRHRHDPTHVHVPARPAEPAGPYRSGKRLFNPDPAYPPVRKGRRAEAPAGAPAEAAPAQKATSTEGQGSGSGTPGGGPQAGDSGSPQAGAQEQAARPDQDATEKENRPPRKGRRR